MKKSASIGIAVVAIALVAIITGIAFLHPAQLATQQAPIEKTGITESVHPSLLATTSTGPHENSLLSDSVAVHVDGNFVSYPGEHPLFHGWVNYKAKHADGTVFLDYTSHNQREVMGLECLLNTVFSPTSYGLVSGNTTCTLGRIGTTSTFTGFNVIDLINGSSTTHATLNGSDTYARSVFGGNRACGTLCGLIPTGEGANQAQPASCTVAGSAYNTITCASPAFSFSSIRAAGTTINGAALINATTGTPTMFAENSFTGVTVANTDTLTITWTLSDS